MAHRIEAAHPHPQLELALRGQGRLVLLLQQRRARREADPLLVERVHEGDRRPSRQRVALGQDQHQFVGAEVGDLQVLGVGPGHEGADVGAAFAQGDDDQLRHLLLDVDADVGMPLGITRQ